MLYCPHVSKPTFHYDGECALCRAWVKRWKRTTGESVEYRPFEPGAKRATSEYVAEDGSVSFGAEGVFRLLSNGSRGRLLWCHDRVPLFASASEFVYRLVSSCRVCAYKFTKWLVHE
jgi:predicted DCC family thiol-disulfide oxidoreductase YuxK